MDEGSRRPSRVGVSVAGRIPSKILHALGPADLWSAALFHNLAPAESPLTHGLGVTYTPQAFERWLDHCSENYVFSSLDDVRQTPPERGGPRRLLVTFDDAYLSVAQFAAPELAARGIPSVFFVNADMLDNRSLALDNFIAAVVNLVGMSPVERVAGRRFASIGDVINTHVTLLASHERRRFRDELSAASGLLPASLLDNYRPYLSTEDLGLLPRLGMEIGNHTRSHVFCRTLDEAAVEDEIISHQRELAELVRRPIRAFAFPYGRSDDATRRTLSSLAASGHSEAFLVGGRLNRSKVTADGSAPAIRHRVSISARSAGEAVAELEVLPLLRSARASLRAVRQ